MTRIRTKIICTMGPAVESYEKILQLIDAGMNVARINFSHGTHEEHARMIANLQRARKEKNCPLSIMLDTKGPEIRIGKVAGDGFSVAATQRLSLFTKSVEGTAQGISIHPGMVLDKIQVGQTILFDDGYISSTVLEKSAEGLVVEIQNGGQIRSNKGVNIPGVEIDLPAMTVQDVHDIRFGCAHDVDLIAASFIRSAEHVLEIKKLLLEQGKEEILVIAKIENNQGVENFDSIVQVADGIMVARGDLGVEMPLKFVPSLQKMMIRKCNEVAKPVVTATQMLESMINNPRPTRAEVSDVANAIYDSTSAVMLSGETAVGLYPIQTVEMMRSIVEEAEEHFPYHEFFSYGSSVDAHDVPTAVAKSSVQTAYLSGAKAIFAFTSGGGTARAISRFRPQMPILALSSNVKTYHQLAFNWGVVPVTPQEASSASLAFGITSKYAVSSHYVDAGDLVVVTAGAPFGVSGSTNMMMVESIGEVLLRGQASSGSKASGKVVFLLALDESKKSACKDAIVLMTRCSKSYAPYLSDALGIILQNHPEDRASEREALALSGSLQIPVLLRAEGASHVLKEGQRITLDPEKGILYS